MRTAVCWETLGKGTQTKAWEVMTESSQQVRVASGYVALTACPRLTPCLLEPLVLGARKLGTIFRTILQMEMMRHRKVKATCTRN